MDEILERPKMHKIQVSRENVKHEHDLGYMAIVGYFNEDTIIAAIRNVMLHMGFEPEFVESHVLTNEDLMILAGIE